MPLVANWSQTAIHIIVDNPSYLFRLEEYRTDAGDQMLFVHMDVRQWNKSALQQMLREFSCFREHVTCPLYALGLSEDDKWLRFISKFGFVLLLDDVICENGAKRRLFVNLKEKIFNGLGLSD